MRQSFYWRFKRFDYFWKTFTNFLDGHFFKLIHCKIGVCLKRPKINDKEAEEGPYLKKSYQSPECGVGYQPDVEPDMA